MRSGEAASEPVVEEVLASTGGLDEEILALIALREQIDALLVDRVGRFDAAQQYKDDGAYSFATWLRARADITSGDAGQLARLARSLQTMRLCAEAVADGTLSVTKARLLARVVNDRTRARFDEHEAVLLDAVQNLDVDNAKILLASWARAADTDGPDPGDPNRNRASLTTGWNGRWHLDADFDPVSGAVIQAVLHAITDRMQQDGKFNDLGDHNTASRRAADSFVEMAHRASGRDPDQPTVHPEIVVVVPHTWRFQDPAGTHCHQPQEEPDPFADDAELLGVGPINWDDVLRLGRDATMSALHVDDDGRPVKLSRKHRVRDTIGDAIAAAATDDRPGQPLDLGRDQRLANKPQWTVLWYRDRGCVILGCHRPAAWCSAHHLKWWDRDHGPTDLANLCLLCSHCHHLLHDRGWTIQQDTTGTWHLTRPNGTRVVPPRYPGHPRSRPRAGPAG